MDGGKAFEKQDLFAKKSNRAASLFFYYYEIEKRKTLFVHSV